MEFTFLHFDKQLVLQESLNVLLHGLGLWDRQGIKPPLRRWGTRDEINGAIVGMLRRKGCGMSLVENLQEEVLVLRGNSGKI